MRLIVVNSHLGGWCGQSQILILDQQDDDGTIITCDTVSGGSLSVLLQAVE